MKKLLFWLMFSLAGLTLYAEEKKYPGVRGSDAEITQKLIGTWTGKRLGFRGTLVYAAHGTCTSDLVPEDFFMKLVANPYSFQGTWKIQKGLLISTVTRSSSKAVAPGTKYRNELLQLTHDTFVTRNERNWVLEFKRVPGKN